MIEFVIKNRFRWRDAPREYGPQDDLQSVYSLEPFGCVQQDFRRVGAHGRQAGADHDRGHASEAHRTDAGRHAEAKQLRADKGYDADWFRTVLAKRRTAVAFLRNPTKTAIPDDPLLFKQRHKIENMFGRLKDWRL